MKFLHAAFLTIAAFAMAGAYLVATSDDAEARRIKAGRHVSAHAVRHVSHPVRRSTRRVARAAAVGVAVGVTVGAAARSYRYSCGNLAYYCNRGQGWACSEYDRRCW